MTNPSALYLPGTTGNYVSTPDSGDLTVNTFEVVVRVAPTDWTPSAINYIVSKVSENAVGINTDGTLRFYAKGSAYSSTAATGFTDGTAKWLRFTRDSTSGDLNFYTADDATDEPTVWSQLGSSVSGATGNTTNTVNELEIGAYSNGSHFTGLVMRAIIRSGATSGGTLVAEFRADAPIEPRYRDSTGKIWTINGSAYSFVEVS